MPWTRKQVKLLLSKASPLSSAQQSKMKDELHANPAMGHAKKGSAELQRSTAKETGFKGSASSYKHQRPERKLIKRTY